MIKEAEVMAHRILLVEDHTASRTTLAILLETSGYDVDTAANGREAVELLARHGYDVVVSDIQMPAMDGVELYRHIQRWWPHLARRVVFMTAHRSSNGRRRTPRAPPLPSSGSPSAYSACTKRWRARLLRLPRWVEETRLRAPRGSGSPRRPETRKKNDLTQRAGVKKTQVFLLRHDLLLRY
jgi:CheY-like chemotaxis protein